MTTSDPIADMLTRIRNANTAKHDTVDIPASKIKVAIAGILVDEGFIEKYDIIEDGNFKTIRVTLKYGADKNEKGEQNYSSYVELNYPFSIKSVDLNATCGFLPYEAGVGVYGVPNSGFAVTNLAL